MGRVSPSGVPGPSGSRLERLHKEAAQALGQVSLMIAKRTIRRHDLGNVAVTLHRVAGEIDEITGLPSGGKQQANRDEGRAPPQGSCPYPARPEGEVRTTLAEKAGVSKYRARRK